MLLACDGLVALGEVEEVDGCPLVGADDRAVPRFAEDLPEVGDSVTDTAEIDPDLAGELCPGDHGQFPLGDLDEPTLGPDGDL